MFFPIPGRSIRFLRPANKVQEPETNPCKMFALQYTYCPRATGGVHAVRFHARYLRRITLSDFMLDTSDASYTTGDTTYSAISLSNLYDPEINRDSLCRDKPSAYEYILTRCLHEPKIRVFNSGVFGAVEATISLTKAAVFSYTSSGTYIRAST